MKNYARNRYPDEIPERGRKASAFSVNLIVFNKVFKSIIVDFCLVYQNLEEKFPLSEIYYSLLNKRGVIIIFRKYEKFCEKSSLDIKIYLFSPEEVPQKDKKLRCILLR